MTDRTPLERVCADVMADIQRMKEEREWRMTDRPVEYKDGQVGHADMMLGRNLSIEVSAYGGSHCHVCIHDMQKLADRLGIDVWCTLNGVRTLSRPGDSADACIEQWNKQVGNAGNANFPPYASA